MLQFLSRLTLGSEVFYAMSLLQSISQVVRDFQYRRPDELPDTSIVAEQVYPLLPTPLKLKGTQPEFQLMIRRGVELYFAIRAFLRK